MERAHGQDESMDISQTPNMSRKRDFDGGMSDSEDYGTDDGFEVCTGRRSRQRSKRRSLRENEPQVQNSKTVIIKSVDVNLCNANPLHVAKALNAIASNYVNRINRVNGGIAVSCYTMAQAAKLKGITQLGKWSVSADYQPSAVVCRGVISGIPLEVTEEELVSECRGDHVVAAKRLNMRRDGKLEKSLSVCFTFSCKNLSDEIRIGYQLYKVRPYVPQVLRCFRCQRLGHSASNCRSKIRCVRCGGPHEFNDCNKKENPKCCRCGGTHSAAYQGCKDFKIQKQVNYVKTTLNISYAEATKKIRNQTDMYDAEVARTEHAQSQADESRKEKPVWAGPVQATVPENRNPIRSGKVVDPLTKKIKTADACTQTVNSQCTQTDNETHVKIGPALAMLMLGAIQICRSDKFKSKTEIEYAMKDLFKKAFNKDLSGKLVSDQAKSDNIQPRKLSACKSDKDQRKIRKKDSFRDRSGSETQ